jgi:hypothetical protein
MMKAWLYGEPTLDEALADPVVFAVMESDEVDADDLRMMLEDVRQGLEDALPRK